MLCVLLLRLLLHWFWRDLSSSQETKRTAINISDMIMNTQTIRNTTKMNSFKVYSWSWLLFIIQICVFLLLFAYGPMLLVLYSSLSGFVFVFSSVSSRDRLWKAFSNVDDRESRRQWRTMSLLHIHIEIADMYLLIGVKSTTGIEILCD